MGIWGWIINSFADKRPEGEPATSMSNPARPNRGSAAVALTDPRTKTETAIEPWWIDEVATETGPISILRPSMAQAEAAIENLLATYFDGHDLNLPPLPHVPGLVLKALRQKDWSVKGLADLIAEDQVLAAAVLRTANSAMFRGTQKISSLQSAVARLGTATLRTLMMHESVYAATFSVSGRSSFATRMWRRALASACLMRTLSRYTGCDEEESFACGLLHDIGNVLVLRIVLKEQGILHCEPTEAVFEYFCFECHQEFGELIAAAWKLPAELSAVIADHHMQPQLLDPHRMQKLQIQVVDTITSILGYGVPGQFNLLETDAIQQLGLHTRQDFVDALDTLPAQVEEMMSSFA